MPVLDLDRFISFVAVEVILWHRKGYPMKQNNYRVYNNPASGQMVFLAHDFDELFGQVDGPIDPVWKGLVAESVLSTPRHGLKNGEQPGVRP